MLGGVFICYRREDSAGFARLIYDRLTNKLGRDSVFFDVDNIPVGLDFVDILSERVGKCDALIAVIGKNWVSSADVYNRRRLDDPNDFVRIEIQTALERKIRVIPVLVDGAPMPQPDNLPDSLKKLVRRQGIEISHTRFDSDVERLTRALALLEEELRQREAVEAERAAHQEQEKREAAETARKAEEAQRVAQAEAQRADEERRAAEAAEAERAAKEQQEKREAAEAAEKAEEAQRVVQAEAQRADEERRAAEAAEAERAAKEQQEKREAAEAAEKAEQARRLAEAETQRAEEERRAREAAEAERRARAERERREATEAAEKAEHSRRLAEAEAARGADEEHRERQAVEEREKLHASEEAGKRPSVMAVGSAGYAADPVVERSPGSVSGYTFEAPGPRHSVRRRLIVGAVTGAVAVGAGILLVEHGSRRQSVVVEPSATLQPTDKKTHAIPPASTPTPSTVSPAEHATNAAKENNAAATAPSAVAVPSSLPAQPPPSPEPKPSEKQTPASPPMLTGSADAANASSKPKASNSPASPVTANSTPVLPIPITVETLTPLRERALGAKDVFKECGDCPEMTVMPSGAFTMGSSAIDIQKGDAFPNEGPQHRVFIHERFAMARHEVTRDEFEAFVAASRRPIDERCYTLENGEPQERDGRSFRYPGFAQAGDHPAVCVSWLDATAYAEWLSRTTGKTYRLPSEAEYEYAARAGSELRFGSTDVASDLCRFVNGADQSAKRAGLPGNLNFLDCTDGYAYTAPVGAFPPNAFGLCDLLGNVWEWTAECYHDDYRTGSSDSSTRAANLCVERAVRGGSWSSPAALLRTAVRSKAMVNNRYDDVGFRVVRELEP